MSTRWFLVDYRYFSVSVKVLWPDPTLPIEPFAGYILDISIRPLVICHIVSLWRGPLRCFRFAFLCTSMPNFEYHSDILETDDTCVYPAPDYPGAGDLVRVIWKTFVFECYVHAIWISGHISYHARNLYTGAIKLGKSLFTGMRDLFTGQRQRRSPFQSGTPTTFQKMPGKPATE